MPAAFVSVFILASSGVLLFLWLRCACRSILRKRFEQDASAEVVDASQMEFLEVRKTLADSPNEADRNVLLEALERDYQALTYLLRKTATGRKRREPGSERLLMLDFQLLRFWVRLKGLLTAKTWVSSLSEMTTILEYFANVLGQRLAYSMNLLAPHLATPTGSSSSVLGVCCYCRNVRLPSRGTTEWVTAEKYHERGGEGSLVLSHGICPQCYENIVRPMLARPQNR